MLAVLMAVDIREPSNATARPRGKPPNPTRATVIAVGELSTMPTGRVAATGSHKVRTAIMVMMKVAAASSSRLNQTRARGGLLITVSPWSGEALRDARIGWSERRNLGRRTSESDCRWGSSPAGCWETPASTVVGTRADHFARRKW